MQNMPTATQETFGTPPVRNTADQRVTFCTMIETNVTVSGVEYCKPRRDDTKAAA
jgi:hypothetical protein